MKANTSTDFYSKELVSFVHYIAVAGHFKGPWDGVGGGIAAVLRRIQRAMQRTPCTIAGYEGSTRLIDAQHCMLKYQEYLKGLSPQQLEKNKNDGMHVLYLNKAAVTRIGKLKEETTTITGTKMHKAFMAMGGRFFLRASRCGCKQCSSQKHSGCINLKSVISQLYDMDKAIGWSEVDVNRKQITGVAVGKIKKTTLESSTQWKVAEKEFYKKLQQPCAQATRMTVAVFCGGESDEDQDANGNLSFWLGDVVRCGGPAGERKLAFVHRASATFRSGGSSITKNTQCVRVKWWKLKRKDNTQYYLYEQAEEQWLPLDTILPVPVDKSTASTHTTLQLHADAATRIEEVTRWVPKQQKRNPAKSAVGDKSMAPTIPEATKRGASKPGAARASKRHKA